MILMFGFKYLASDIYKLSAAQQWQAINVSTKEEFEKNSVKGDNFD